MAVVTLYRQVGKGKARRYQKVNLGRGRRPTDLAGPYFLRYSHANGTRPWEPVGDDLDAAIDAQDRKQAYFEALDANVPVTKDLDESGRTKITDAVFQWFAELQLFQGKDQQGKSEKTLRAYNYRLGFFLDFTVQQNLRFLDQIDRNQLLRYVKFLREHESDLDDRTVHNIFETLNTWLRTRDILIAGKILAELDYAEKPPKPYTKQELKEMFAAMDEEEKLLYGLFLNSGVRDALVLFAPNFAVIFGSHFEEFTTSVSRKLTALASQLFQFGSREWLEMRGDSKVLIENFHRVDTANRSCNRQTHGIAQSLLSRYTSVSNHFPNTEELPL